ncbi:MAG: glycosyltransferase family 2 protein [Lachnospiraceae bacterium]|nr:glycosyltransferase family 2 protein [Lachnospiraceae bacterium]
MPLFSIVMPVYNNEKYFPIAVQSILQQDYEDFELIIVDDGSTDKTPKIADELAAQDKRIHVIHQKNQWIYASFNNGIKEARGSYIYIVNSDDRLMPGALSLMAQKVREYHPDIIWTKVVEHFCDSEQRIIEYDKRGRNGRVTQELYYGNTEEVRKGWTFFITSFLAYDQANLYRREIMQSQLFRNDVYGADVLYNISIADQIKSALVLPDPIYTYYVYENPDMNASFGKYYPYVHDMYNEIFEQYQDLFLKWNLPRKHYIEVLCKRRIVGLTTEVRGLLAENCPMTLEEKLEFIFYDCIDDTVKQCVEEINGAEEAESRILSGVRDLLVKETISKENKMYFVYELLDSLLRYEKDEDDIEKIEKAIHHPLNPMQIGNTFYKKLIQGRA